MPYELYMPRNKQQREDVFNKIIASGKQVRHTRQVRWWLNHHYLQGARDFTNINYSAGTLDVNYINEDGVLRFRYDEIVAKFQAQVGRLMQIDLAPRVQKKSIGLEDLRKASIAQIALDAAFPPSKVETLKLQMLPPLTKYGLIGLIVWSEGEEVGIDVAMPWELLPIPPNPTEDKDVRGLIRLRTVPVDWVQRLAVTPDSGAKVYGEMEQIHAPVGQVPTSGDRFNTYAASVSMEPHAPQIYGSKSKGRGSRGRGEDKTHVNLVELAEIWLETSTGYLGRYEMMAGKKLIYTKDYSKNKVYMPANVCHDIKTGGFWGRSFIDIQIPLNVEMEYTLGTVFQNIQDLDAYGILCIPQTLGIPPAVTRASDGTKRLFYSPDYTQQDLKPFSLMPAKTGLLPAKVLELGTGLADKMANQPGKMMKGEAPGRVDSQAGLGFLYEVSNTPLTPTATGIASAVSNCYRAILDTIAVEWPKEKLIQVTMLDDTLAGISFDPQTGSIRLAENVLPRPDEILISVRSMLPRSKEQEKMELMKSLEIGAIDMFEYRVEVRKRGLELPAGNEPEWQNYRRAMMENIILFSDGQSPGEVIVDMFDLHAVHLRVLQAFMARPEFYAATPEVRDVFKKHYAAHLEGIGNTMPDQAPYPEEAAEEAEAQERMNVSGPI